MKTFIITLTDNKTKTVRANNWQNSGLFTLFTVQDSGVVFAIQSQFVMSIERVDGSSNKPAAMAA